MQLFIMIYSKIRKKNNIVGVILFFLFSYYFLGDDIMFIKIPFESNIEFNTNISEITKMSLEHDYNVSGNEVLGNFYISGEYKTHEVSINKEPFRYTLPFTVSISDRINEDSLEFNIEDFSYDIVGNNTLKVNIEYSLSATELEDNEEEERLFEKVDEDELEEELNIIDDFLDSEEIVNKNADSNEEEKEENTCDKEEVQEEREKDTEENNEEVEVKEDEVKEEKEEERLTNKEEKTIMETIKDSDDTFVTYHIHIVKESETLESISTIYGVPSSLVKEYNDFDNLSVGDKVLIPKVDE